jgi:hypothetical protein
MRLHRESGPDDQPGGPAICVTCETGPVSEQPGRYQRSFSGMLGALVVLLLVIGGFIAFRAVTRDDLEVEPEQVDYLETVRLAQQADLTVVYPPSVPEGWQATSVESQPGREWGIGFLTPDGFAGLHQSDTPVDELLATYVDEETEELDPVDIGGAGWEAWQDADGDVGYLGEVDGEQVLVYGSVPATDLQDLAASLTTAPLTP